MTENPLYTERGRAAYHAAQSTLAGRFNGNLHSAAEDIARRLYDRDDLPELARSYEARSMLVSVVMAPAIVIGVEGGVQHARPLIDIAIAAAAKAMLDADPDTGHAHLVVSDRQIGWAGLDGVRADEYARTVGGVVVRVPIVADYRPAGEGDRR